MLGRMTKKTYRTFTSMDLVALPPLTADRAVALGEELFLAAKAAEALPEGIAQTLKVLKRKHSTLDTTWGARKAVIGTGDGRTREAHLAATGPRSGLHGCPVRFDRLVEQSPRR